MADPKQDHNVVAKGELSDYDQMVIDTLKMPGTHGRISAKQLGEMAKSARDDTQTIADLCGRMGCNRT